MNRPARLPERLKNTAGTAVEPARPHSAEDDRAAEEILRKRAAEYARVSVEPSTASDAVEVLVVVVQGERYGLPVSLIGELLKDVPVTPVPGGPDVLRGIVNLRGDVLPVFDGGRILKSATMTREHGGGAAATRLPWLVVLDDAGEEAGLSVDAVEGVREVAIEELERLSASEKDDDGVIVGVTADAVSIVDGDRLRSDPRLYVEEAE
ncbi:MAG: chemotaxis protein CheW [Planctomycetota bacterium]|nr:MAG: chemotaxis protein CheW [Planctomycetota bacterium]